MLIQSFFWILWRSLVLTGNFKSFRWSSLEKSFTIFLILLGFWSVGFKYLISIFKVFIIRVVIVHYTWSKIHDPTVHDSCINYANMLTLFRDKQWHQGSKKLSVICKDLVSWVKKISLTKEVTIFKNYCFLFWNFLMKII